MIACQSHSAGRAVAYKIGRRPRNTVIPAILSETQKMLLADGCENAFLALSVLMPYPTEIKQYLQFNKCQQVPEAEQPPIRVPEEEGSLGLDHPTGVYMICPRVRTGANLCTQLHNHVASHQFGY